jgi:anti-anti-sigma factor
MERFEGMMAMEQRDPLLQIVRDNGSFRLVGEIDMSNAAELARVLKQGANGGDLVVDCTDLRFVDSTGIAAILEVSRGLENGDKLVLRSPTTSLRKAMRVLGLDGRANIVLSGS